MSAQTITFHYFNRKACRRAMGIKRRTPPGKLYAYVDGRVLGYFTMNRRGRFRWFPLALDRKPLLHNGKKPRQ